MYLLINLLVGVIVAGLATVLTQWLEFNSQDSMPLFFAYAGATLCTALLIYLMQGSWLSSGNQRSNASSSSEQPNAKTSRSPKSAEHEQREVGSVKWFNVSKGYGFITKDDGEEIFVHFRSIKGGGRRGLKDGQRVSFVVVQSEKGPQAEDVERAS